MFIEGAIESALDKVRDRLVMNTPNKITRFEEIEAKAKTAKICSKLNESIYIAANEPSLGMYRVQEHVRFSIPKLARCQREFQNIKSKVEGASYDLEYDTETLKKMGSLTQFTAIRNKIRKAIEIRQNWEKKEYQKKLATPEVGSIPVNASKGGYLAHVMTVSGQPVTSTEHHTATATVSDKKDDREKVETTSETPVTVPGMAAVAPEAKVNYTLPRLDPKTMPFPPSNKSDSPDFVPKSFDV